MSSDNPYSPPRVEIEPVAAEPIAVIALWRQRDLLVAAYGTEFPDRCPISNRPATTRYPYEFSNLPSGLKLFLLFGIGIWLTILAEMTATKIRLRIPLDDEIVGLSRIHLAIGSVGAIAGIGVVALGLLVPSVSQVAGLLISLGIFTLAASAIWVTFFRQDLSAHNVTASHVWISGAHPDFLADLPEWTGGKN